jgi:predicted secreted protein
MQTSIFDLPLHSTIADLPTAIIKPKPDDWFVVADKPKAIAPRASPRFAIGEIVQSSKYFKKLTGEIIGFEQYGDIDFAIVRYHWHGSNVDYPAIASSLTPVNKTHLLGVGLVDENPQPIAENPQTIADNQQLKTGDRVKVLKHQFMGDRIGVIQNIEGKMATVYFGATENIWCIYTGRLQRV